jgi:Ni/Fe-hydrogenase subunit HybB-like protein
MKRVLVIRLLALELGPLVAALAVSAYSERLMGPAFLAASIVVLLSVILSIRDGAVLEKWGYICERKNEPRSFWFWVAAHFYLALFPFVCAMIILFWPPRV